MAARLFPVWEFEIEALSLLGRAGLGRGGARLSLPRGAAQQLQDHIPHTLSLHLRNPHSGYEFTKTRIRLQQDRPRVTLRCPSLVHNRHSKDASHDQGQGSSGEVG